MYKGEHALDRLRRPVEAGDRLPDAVAAAAPPARPRGLPRRRLLPALAAARARREALRRARRRVAHRAADHRDQGQRRLRVHPDERHLDHRRADLPRTGPVLRRRPAGDQRRHLGSRVGGNAQIKAMKKVAGRLRIDLAQYRALEAFAQFGSELDKASQQQLARGARVVEILKQPQYDPRPSSAQVVAIWAATGGHLDDLPGRGREAVRRRVRRVPRTRGRRHPRTRSGSPATCPRRPRRQLKAVDRGRSRDVRSSPSAGEGRSRGRGRTRTPPRRGASPTWAGTACPRRDDEDG